MAPSQGTHTTSASGPLRGWLRQSVCLASPASRVCWAHRINRPAGRHAGQIQSVRLVYLLSATTRQGERAEKQEVRILGPRRRPESFSNYKLHTGGSIGCKPLCVQWSWLFLGRPWEPPGGALHPRPCDQARGPSAWSREGLPWLPSWDALGRLLGPPG